MFDKYNKKASIREHGTLRHTQKYPKKSNVVDNTKACLDESIELLTLLVHSYIAAIGMKAMKTTSLDDEPTDFAEWSLERKKQLKDQVVDEVLKLAFHPPDIDHVSRN